MRKLTIGTLLALLGVAMLWSPVGEWMLLMGAALGAIGCYYALIGQRELGGPL